jgi:hypothetical protein
MDPMKPLLPPAFFIAACLVALAGAGFAHADDAKPPGKPPCPASEHRQFDFWLGDWEVRDPAGKVVGHNQLTSLHKGCAMLESWAGTGGYTGSSLNIYDADRRKWHQTWVDSSGGLLLLEGAWTDGRMVLSGETTSADAPGEVTVNRITWQPLPDGRVRQLWESSTDKGRTWKTAFDGYYAKQK